MGRSPDSLTPAPQFALGSIVRLKTGGKEMVVVGYEFFPSGTLVACPVDTTFYACTWHDNAGVNHTAKYPDFCLVTCARNDYLGGPPLPLKPSKK